MSLTENFKLKFNQLLGKTPAASANLDDDDSIADPVYDDAGTSAFGKLAIGILLVPFQVLLLPLKALGMFHSAGIDVDYDDAEELTGGARFLFGLKRAGKFLLFIPYMILTAPIRFIQGLGQTSTREILFIIPALLMIGFFGFVIFRMTGGSDSVKNRYAIGAQKALMDKDYKLAKTYFGRLMAEEELTQPQRLQWAIVLSETGDVKKAKEVLNELAPDDNLGYGPAHRLQAIILAAEMGKTKDEMALSKLGNHLARTGDQSPETLEAWAIYHRKLGQHDDAIEKLNQAAQLNPNYYLTIARYQLQLDRKSDNRTTLALAGQAFSEQLLDNPLNHQVRLSLVTVRTMQRRFDDAEAIIVDGLQKQPSKNLRSAAAAFFVMRHEEALRQNDGVNKRLNYLMKALTVDANFPPVYEKMMMMYLNRKGSQDDMDKIILELNQLVAGDEPHPMAHFALSNILWANGEQKKAEFHLKQARLLAPDMGVILNNLAWMVSHSNEPELERGLELVNEALLASPGNRQFLDTRGTILMKLERYEEAIPDLKLSLPGVMDKKKVHAKLSIAYDKIGMEQQSQHHLENSKK